MGTSNKIGKYDVIRVLGAGGMGTVYQCIDPDMQRFVAIKVLNNPKKHSALEVMKKRFLREALTTAQLQHPSIPPVYEVGQTPDNQLYYVMKPIEGQPLEGIIDKLKANDEATKEKFDLYRLIGVLKDVCMCIDYAHNRGHIHRDLKPSNIFVGNFGEVYVIDWGLTKIVKDSIREENAAKLKKFTGNLDFDAKNLINYEVPLDYEKAIEIDNLTHTILMEPDDDDLSEELTEKSCMPIDDMTAAEDDFTKTQVLDTDAKDQSDNSISQTITMQGKILGTLSYMSPEQALGDNANLGKESDIYSLGVILYEILTLEVPIPDKNLKASLHKKMKGEIESPDQRSTKREVPPELATISMQAMNPHPIGRFKSVKDFANALDFWLEGKPFYKMFNIRFNGPESILLIPEHTEKSWIVIKDSITTLHPENDNNTGHYLLFNHEFIGNIIFNAKFLAMPINENKNEISEISFIINASLPDTSSETLEAYSIHLGASKNTRAFIAKHDIEVVSNDYVSLEPYKAYNISIERKDNCIMVSLNGDLILLYQENHPFSGMYAGLANKGGNVVFSEIKIRNLGMPVKISAIEVPETLMEEGCYEAARKNFLSIAIGHRTRYIGAWARYRAGIASYMLTHNKESALKIWEPLKKSHFSIFEKLGRARLEMENDCHLEAIKILSSLIHDETTPVTYIEPVADMAFLQSQQWLRHKQPGQEEWQIIDGWIKLSLGLAKKMDRKHSMISSLVWRWLIFALDVYPQHIPDCIFFLRKTFGADHGELAELVTRTDSLVNLILRSLTFTSHGFLVDKLMRLVLYHEDIIGNLETLFRFYLISGHVSTAGKIASHTACICRKTNVEIPSAPLVFLAWSNWLNGKEAENLVAEMEKHSSDFVSSDGKILRGLIELSRNNQKGAETLWQEVSTEQRSMAVNRHFAALSLLNQLTEEQQKEDMPNIISLKIFFCTVNCIKAWIDWKKSDSESDKNTAIDLFEKTCNTAVSSHDIYSDMLPLLHNVFKNIAHEIHINQHKAESLSKPESEWVNEIIRVSLRRTEQNTPQQTPII